MALTNTFTGGTVIDEVFAQRWTTKLQERLDYPQNWKEICRVEYTDSKILNNPFMTTASVPTATSHSRGTEYTLQEFALQNDSVNINQSRIVPMFIDRADLAQTTFMNHMEMADLQATILNEYLETDMLANHAAWTNFDNASIGGAAGNITVSASNIDDIIRGLKREIRENNAHNLAMRNGIFIVWRAADFEILEAFVQANGFSTADTALKDGTVTGFRYMGVDHYVSNSHASGHVFAGVKNVFHLGVCKSTYGQIVINQDPPGGGTAGKALSGTSVVSRLDWEYKAWTLQVPALFDVLVN